VKLLEMMAMKIWGEGGRERVKDGAGDGEKKRRMSTRMKKKKPEVKRSFNEILRVVWKNCRSLPGISRQNWPSEK
jgi:hypothetical protein